MPKHVIEDAMVTLDGVDISTRVKKLSLITRKRSPQNVSAMTNNWEEHIGIDVRGWRVQLDLMQDYSTANVYSVLKGMLDSTNSSGHPIIIRPTTAGRSATNPEWQGSVLLDGDFAFVDAEFAGVNMAPVNLIGNGTLTSVTTST